MRECTSESRGIFVDLFGIGDLVTKTGKRVGGDLGKVFWLIECATLC